MAPVVSIETIIKNIYIHIADPIDDIRELDNPTEIIISKPKIDVLFEYPLTNKVLKTFNADTTNGFTAAGLIQMICDFYKEIYEEEDRTTNIPSENIPNMLNRNETTGKYGIWGHAIGDLYLHTMEYDNNNDFYTLGIDS